MKDHTRKLLRNGSCALVGMAHVHRRTSNIVLHKTHKNAPTVVCDWLCADRNGCRIFLCVSSSIASSGAVGVVENE